MTSIQFYHLTSSPLETALPRLLEKAYEQGFRIHVKVADAGMMAALDKSLWTYTPLAFLPHATDADAKPERHPILLSTTLENRNAANVLCITDDTLVDADAAYEKVIDMFNGQDAHALELARERWKHYQGQSRELSYFQQTDSGWKKQDVYSPHLKS